MNDNSKSNFIDILKKKAINFMIAYFKKNFEEVKKDVFRVVERRIERKIKKFVNKLIYSSLAFISFVIGGFILLYGIIFAIISLLSLPDFLVSIVYGLLLIILGFIFYLFT